jgi:hypothetical protein
MIYAKTFNLWEKGQKIWGLQINGSISISYRRKIRRYCPPEIIPATFSGLTVGKFCHIRCGKK